MINIQREDIYSISSHSNMTAAEIESALKENVYNNKSAWQTFFKMFFITLGVGFTVTGIVFFFAYNWEDLHKFTKLGLIEALIIGTTSLVLVNKFSSNIKNIILTGCVILTGALFAVFGQIYQTGANAYDFFLAWTIFVTLWVMISNFAPLWLIYLLLINTTLFLYANQVAHEWPSVVTYCILFSINLTAFVASFLISKYNTKAVVPQWFLNTVAIASISFGTLGIVFGIFDDFHMGFLILIALFSAACVLGYRYGLKAKNGFYLSIIPFSLIVIISALLMKLSNGGSMLLLVCLFIIASVTLVIHNLIQILKKG